MSLESHLNETKVWQWWVLLAVFGTMVALGIILMPGSFVNSATSMDAYFGGEHLGSWKWSFGSWSWDISPFGHRILFHGMVDLCVRALAFMGLGGQNIGTYWVSFVTVSCACVVLAIFALDGFLHALGYSRRKRAIGIAIWMLLPAIHFAYLYPIQTKEDFLAYALTFFGLTLVLKARFWSILVISLACALTRETLLLVPLFAALAMSGNWLLRLMPLVLGASTLLGLRFVLPLHGLSVWKGLEENLSNPLQVLVAAFLALGFGWPILLAVFRWNWYEGLRLVKYGFGNHATIETKHRLFASLLPWTLVILLSAHFLFGRMVEIRISALLAPWIVVGGIDRIIFIVQSRNLRPILAFVLALVVIIAIEVTGCGSRVREAINPQLGQFANAKWWLEIYMQLALTIGVLSVRQWDSLLYDFSASRKRDWSKN